MLRYTARRLLFTLPVLWGVTVVVFLLVRLLPGDIATYILGPGAPAEQVAALRRDLGLDRPWHQQYLVWLGNAARGNLGYSNQYRRPVAEVIWQKFNNTIVLAAGALTLSVIIGVSVGTFSGTRPNTLPDRMATTVAIVLASLPGYFVGLVLMYIFALKLRWFPSTGMYSVTDPGGLPDLLHHLVLPAITTAAVPMAVISRLVRSQFIEVMQQDYIRTGRAKGLRERVVILRHALRNAMPTTINIVALQLGYLLGGSIFAEVIFSWPGMGQQLYASIGARDAAVIQAIALLVASIFILANFAADAAHGILDPRVRLA
ncbi:MAG: ABC transporter permease [Dehalococcoidia bacterium]